VKIYVAPVEALRKKERGDETQFTTQMMMKPCPTPLKESTQERERKRI
jgi:hypothetical protein